MVLKLFRIFSFQNLFVLQGGRGQETVALLG